MQHVLAALMAMFVSAAAVQAEVVIETVIVGNPGNTPERSGSGDCSARYCGAVDYIYHIGKFEITAGQYTQFLNAVAALDTYGLYNSEMWSHGEGCKIERTGSSGSYSYTVAGDWADRPVNFVSWGDAARFANWLHNGQPGRSTPVPQDQNSTEDGSYDLSATQSYYGPDGETPPQGTDDYDALHHALITAVRKGQATWVIPSEDEWYKAAYHHNDGATADYYFFPTSSNIAPDCVDDSLSLSGTGTPFTEGGIDPGNYVTYDCDRGTLGIGSPYYRTKVGEWENSASPYGTSDQAGNVAEWNEEVLYECDGPLCDPECRSRGVRGGSYGSGNHHDYTDLWASDRNARARPAGEGFPLGFRVAKMPVFRPADLDGDGSVALQDHSLFIDCMSGPNRQPYFWFCSRSLFHRADMDGDDDVDFVDHALFTERYTGP